MRPLYQEASEGVTRRNGHTGLWYDKFFDQWQFERATSKLSIGDEGKKDWIKTVTEQDCGNSDHLKQAQTRMVKLLEHQGQEPLFYKLESDFVTGLGREHPVENGFAWHHTLGTPYLLGSSVKGMVRAWAERWEAVDIQVVRRIFGPSADDLKNDKELTANVGSVIFLDAVPTQSVQLKADVMTPHYAPYYKDASGQTPPADWHSPIPIPFLVVEKDQTFIFGVMPRRDDEAGRADCEQVKVWLKEALEWTGAGAKTAVGYGRFGPDEAAKGAFKQAREKRQAAHKAEVEKKQRQLELERQTAGKSELYNELYTTSRNERWRENKNTFSQAGLIEGWLDRLEADPQADAITHLAELINHHFQGLLENPAAMKGKRNDKPVFKDRQRTFAKRVNKLLEST